MSVVRNLGSVFSAFGTTAAPIIQQGVPGVGGTILGVISGAIGLAGDLMQNWDNPIEHITRIRSAETERAKVHADVNKRIRGE